MNDQDRNPLTEIVGTVTFTTPELKSEGNSCGVLLHLKVDDPSQSSNVREWLMTVLEAAGAEMHWDLCGPGDTTEL